MDQIPLKNLVLTCCITLPKVDPRPSPSPWDFLSLSKIVPGETMPFRLDSHQDTKSLADWIWYFDSLAGMNLGFDIPYLRYISPLLREALTERLQVIDLSVLNYLECDSRPERSLKTLGPVLGTHVYEEQDLERLASIEEILGYNAQDTHNTFLSIVVLALSILRRLGPSPFTLRFYSDTIWSCIRMSENGVPFSLSRLITLRDRLLIQAADIEKRFERARVPLAGKGSNKSKRFLMDRMIDAAIGQYNANHPETPTCANANQPSDLLPSITVPTADEGSTTPNTSIEPSTPPEPKPSTERSGDSLPFGAPPVTTNGESLSTSSPASVLPWPDLDPSLPHPLSHPLLVKTDKTHEISFSSVNRTLVLLYLPPSHPAHALNDLIEDHTHARKITGSFIWPLLHYRRQKKNGSLVLSSLLVPQIGDPHPCQTPLPAPPPAPDAASGILMPSPKSEPTSSSSSPSSEPEPSSTSSVTPCSRRPWNNPARNPDVYLSHPSWFVTPSPFKDGEGSSGGTMQARITCKDSAHQTEPEEITGSKQHQPCRLSRFLGGCIVSMDLSQIELRVAALLSGEPSMLDAYNLGWDLHSRRAATLWDLPDLETRYPGISQFAIEKWKSNFPGFGQLERDVSKHVNFADLFWAQASTQQTTVLKMSGRLIPLSVFQRAVDARPQVRPVLFAWQSALVAQAKAEGRITLPIIGQSRLFMGGDDFESSEIINFPVQATAGNLMLRLQHRIFYLLDQAALSNRILLHLNVYDALYFDLCSPFYLTPLKKIVADAVQWVIQHDYWGSLQHHLGRICALDYEFSKPY